MSFTPPLNLPTLKQKGLVKLWQGLSLPFFFTTEVVAEGQPMKPHASPDTALPYDAPQKMQAAVMGEGAKVFGLAMQVTYDDANYGELAGYHFANNTKQRTNGMPIGVLTGVGEALLAGYQGTVVAGHQLAIGPSGLLIDATTAGIGSSDKVPVWADTGGTAPDFIRIRYSFSLAVGG